MQGSIRRRLRTAVGVFAAFTLVGMGALGFSGTAGAATPAPDCKDVKSTFVAHPDNGHAGHWADLSGTRTVHICVDSMPLLQKSVEVQGATFHATVTDVGTLVTLGGDHLSPNHGAKLIAGVHGSWHGGFKATFQAPAPTAPGVWPNFDASTLDGKTFHGTEGPTTGSWIKALWKQADLKVSEGGWTDAYSWTYRTCNEQWIDAENNNDGQGPGAGDITGLSRRPCAVPPVFTDNCDGTVTVLVGNTAPSPDAVAVYVVAGDGNPQIVIVKGQADGKATGTATVLPGKSMPLKGKVAVALKGAKDKPVVHTYTQPKTCTSPSTSPSPSSSTPVVGLPVTGANTTGLLVAGLSALVVGTGVMLFLGRRRRTRFEA